MQNLVDREDHQLPLWGIGRSKGRIQSQEASQSITPSVDSIYGGGEDGGERMDEATEYGIIEQLLRLIQSLMHNLG